MTMPASRQDKAPVDLQQESAVGEEDPGAALDTSGNQAPRKSTASKIGEALGSVGAVIGLPPVEVDPGEARDSGPDPTRSPKAEGHPTRKRQSDLGSG
ncbi:MAG: hypothetical protein J0H69_18330 [Burkholderiales bacterium]|jgi:hypothetical protein|nr:hypothetical protein [Burkholderiales bacterium]